MPIKANELRRGQALLWEGQLQVVIDTEFVKPGKGPAYVQAKMRNVATGTSRCIACYLTRDQQRGSSRAFT